LPFKIIRNDITKVKADAIVNTANPEPRYGSGTDAAIYKAAGADDLLAERKKIGRIAPGEAAVTAAFALPAKYIIHTIGPAWIDGKHGEYDILRSCYRKSLLLADQLGCESIAFPLIATGVYGFPKDQALEIALSVIREHLEDSDLDVTLVVFGRGSYQIASGLTEQIEEYIDENYVAAQTEEEYGVPFDRRSESRRRRELWEREKYLGSIHLNQISSDAMAAPLADVAEEDLAYPTVGGSASAFQKPKQKKASLEDVVNNLGESFQARLLRMIDERGMTDPEVYKRANVDRKLFSKIRCSEDYIPKKKTIVALAIALRLNLDDTRDLLASAGLMLTNNSKADVIVSFCIENGIYDIYEVNALLFKFHQPILG
jgi:O-acetyl-ADP-ribose deacetylase (regulator of RNase III)